MTDSNDKRSPLHHLYNLYRAVADTIPPRSRLWSWQYEICGLEQCIQSGPNLDSHPKPDTLNYYRWGAWKKQTLVIAAAQTKEREDFIAAAMSRYIATVHLYLRTLHYFPSTCQQEEQQREQQQQQSTTEMMSVD